MQQMYLCGAGHARFEDVVHRGHYRHASWFVYDNKVLSCMHNAILGHTDEPCDLIFHWQRYERPEQCYGSQANQ